MEVEEGGTTVNVDCNDVENTTFPFKLASSNMSLIHSGDTRY